MSKKFLAACALTLPALGAFAEEVKWPVPPAGFNQASSSIPKGTVSARIMYPTRNHQQRACKVYTPPGYSATRAEKYPVLYLQHGIGGNENAWTAAQTDGQEGNADKVMDYLYAQANLNVTPMIVVMAMGNITGASDAWGAFEDVLMNDLAPYIQANYNASSAANMRALAGLSMGAGQTLNIGYKNPAFFNWLGAFSPAPNTTAAGTTMNTPAKIEAVKTNVKLAFLAAGTAEQNPYLNNARNYHNFLQTNGVTPLYLQVEEGLGHEPRNWNRQLYNFAQRIFKGSPTEIIQLPKKSIAKGGDGRIGSSSRFLVSRGGTYGVSTAIFTLDGRALPSRSLPAILLEAR